MKLHILKYVHTLVSRTTGWVVCWVLHLLPWDSNSWLLFQFCKVKYKKTGWLSLLQIIKAPTELKQTWTFIVNVLEAIMWILVKTLYPLRRAISVRLVQALLLWTEKLVLCTFLTLSMHRTGRYSTSMQTFVFADSVRSSEFTAGRLSIFNLSPKPDGIIQQFVSLTNRAGPSVILHMYCFRILYLKLNTFAIFQPF